VALGKGVIALVSAAIALLIVGCSPVKHTSITGTLRSTVRVTYTVTTESASSAKTTITYTDPLDGSQTAVPAKPAWTYTWPRVPAVGNTALQVRVAGPNPGRNTCAIRINGQPVIAEAGHTGQASGTPVTCSFTLSPANT
jgi:hypothetical protein